MNDKKWDAEIELKIEYERKAERPSFKERCADKVSSFGGSWGFLTCFVTFFLSWVTLNALWLHYDNYPFIFLNLMLSCLAVFQAPFILMSQNRMSGVDRKREENSYKINIKEEMEIRILNEKLDEILNKLK